MKAKMDELTKAYNAASKFLSGRDLAEIEIEARRDAHESNGDITKNPYEKGSFARLCFLSECNKIWQNEETQNAS